MGNCIACHSQPKRKTGVPLVEGRGVEPVEKMNLDSSKHYIMVLRKLQDGEVYHLVPFHRQSFNPSAPCWTNGERKSRARNVKIVVTREQLELLLSGSKKLHIKSRVARIKESYALQGCRKWQPSLPTIQEVENY